MVEDLVRECGHATHDDYPVLVWGETGAGKEVVARLIHELAETRGPFLAVNCGALPEGLVEAELFGCVQGAYTGATRARPGLFVEARGGTLLLDEITEVPLSMQVKVLRVIQDGLVRPVGSTRHVSAEARVIATTNRNPAEALEQGRLRRDLYFRLSVHRLRVPPLREHPEDIPELAAAFLQRWRTRAPELIAPTFTGDAVAELQRAPWPGNVRELEHCIYRIAAMNAGARVGPDEVRAALDPDNAPSAQTPAGDAESLSSVERAAVVKALRATGGNKAAAARLLGVTRKTLYHKLRVHSIDPKAP